MMASRDLRRFLVLVILCLLSVPLGLDSHGGGLDSLGCHHNRKLGGYHCHRGPLAGRSFASKDEALKALEKLKGAGEAAEPEGAAWRTVVRDRLERAGRGETSYTYLAVPRAVFVVPVTDAGELVLVRQYRHPVRDWTLEVPAGSVDDGEALLEAAQRELAEEAGGRARDWRHLSAFYSSSAHISLRSDAFLATGVTLGAPSLDEGEEISVVLMPVAEALAQARAGGLADGETALAILLAAPHLERRS